MEIRSTLISGPEQEPLTLAEVKLDREVSHDLHDALFTNYIQAAREMCENRTGRALLPQTWQQLCVNADSEMPLERWPATEILSININGETLDHNALIEQGVIFFGKGDAPVLESNLFRGARVVIQYSAGYASASDVPAALKKWMLLQIGSMYEYRESEQMGTVVQRLRFPDGLINPYIIRRFW